MTQKKRSLSRQGIRAQKEVEARLSQLEAEKRDLEICLGRMDRHESPEKHKTLETQWQKLQSQICQLGHRPEKMPFADYEKAERVIGELRSLRKDDAWSPECWRTLTISHRREILQSVEDRLAAIDERPAERVHYLDLGAQCGYGRFCDGRLQDDQESEISRGIYLNANSLNTNDPVEMFNTIVHESRHAYQDYAVQNRHKEFHSKLPNRPHWDDVAEWEQNLLRPKDVDKHGEVPYMTSSTEHDAACFAFMVTRGVFPNYRPSQTRIEQYNWENAENKFGHLLQRWKKLEQWKDDEKRVQEKVSSSSGLQVSSPSASDPGAYLRKLKQKYERSGCTIVKPNASPGDRPTKGITATPPKGPKRTIQIESPTGDPRRSHRASASEPLRPPQLGSAGTGTKASQKMRNNGPRDGLPRKSSRTEPLRSPQPRKPKGPRI